MKTYPPPTSVPASDTRDTQSPSPSRTASTGSPQSSLYIDPGFFPSSTRPAPTTTFSPVPTELPVTSHSDDRSLRVRKIALTSAFSAVGVIMLVAAYILYRKHKQRRPPFFRRGITPINDEEIESWKISREIRDEEKSGGVFATDAGIPESGPATGAAANAPGHVRGKLSTSSLKKMPSTLIVYQNTSATGAGRQSDDISPHSHHSSDGLEQHGPRSSGGRPSTYPGFPQTPVLARAPNAREGLTDDSVPGDEPFLLQPRMQPARISKLPRPPSTHKSLYSRSRNSRSSLRSLAERDGDRLSHDHGNPYSGSYTTSEQYLPPRYAGASIELPNGTHHGQAQLLEHRLRHSKSSTGHHGHARGHSRVYSNSGSPSTQSISDQVLGSLRQLTREDIGRAIG